ncbi:AlpA family phage regulatory protein [Janthinobacterium lividum]|uniref:helix-turn-helix transcriptional regulator n=1 Tax=Janthinobacterium TaxID=29580 RepID=UPI0009E41644|nr:AlpA family phage regulatory protein [Janthinobacterium lividum]
MQILRIPAVCQMLGLSRVTVWRRVKLDPSFPRPVRLGTSDKSAVGFLQHELNAWIAGNRN